jgi:nicotinamidase-related amidase
MNTALLLIDIQNDYFPGGRMEVAGSVEATAAAAKVLQAYRRAQLPVLHIQHVSDRPGATFFLPGTVGALIHESVRPLAGETVITKHFPNSFRETPLLDTLRKLEIGRLSIVGMMTHMCIDATTRAAFDLGFKCRVAYDACATRNLAFQGETVSAHEVQFAFLSALGAVYAQILSAEELAAAVAQGAGN